MKMTSKMLEIKENPNKPEGGEQKPSEEDAFFMLDHYPSSPDGSSG